MLGPQKKVLLKVVMLMGSFNLATLLAAQHQPGEYLYKRNCARCHGASGAKGLLGAKNLEVSVLTDSAIVQQIEIGKGFMPSFKKRLTANEINQIVRFVKSLRRLDN